MKIVALFSVYFFWGTTYLAMKFAVETLPPYLMLATRFGAAGFLMFAFLRSRGVENPSLVQWKGAFYTGAIMLFMGTGCVTLAELYVPSNIAASVIASVPLWMAFFQWMFFRGDKPGTWSIVGLVVGFVGVVMLVLSSGESGGTGTLAGYLLLIFASAAWAFGSLVSRVIDVPKSPLMSISIQMMMGSACCFAAAAFAGEFSPDALDIAKFSARSLFAVLYLVVFGSFVGYGSYIWLLRNTSPTLASTYAYVNPVVAIFMGWLLAGETLKTTELVPIFIILIAVVAIIKDNANKKPPE